MVAADKTNEHGGSSANPPAASLYGERNNDRSIKKNVLISIELDGPLYGGLC